jgi:hypothetical protein
MRRWHREVNLIRREWRLHRQSHVEGNKRRSGLRVGLDPDEVDCPCDEQIGRFRKRDAFDCGNARCQICHGDKYPKREPSGQELRSEVSFREQKKELDSRDGSR